MLERRIRSRIEEGKEESEGEVIIVSN